MKDGTKVKATKGKNVLVGTVIGAGGNGNNPPSHLVLIPELDNLRVWLQYDWTIEEIKPANRDILAGLPLGGVFLYTSISMLFTYIKIGPDSYARYTTESDGRSVTRFTKENFENGEISLEEQEGW